MEFLKTDELILGDPVFYGGYSADVLEQTVQSRRKHKVFEICSLMFSEDM